MSVYTLTDSVHTELPTPTTNPQTQLLSDIYDAAVSQTGDTQAAKELLAEAVWTLYGSHISSYGNNQLQTSCTGKMNGAAPARRNRIRNQLMNVGNNQEPNFDCFVELLENTELTENFGQVVQSLMQLNPDFINTESLPTRRSGVHFTQTEVPIYGSARHGIDHLSRKLFSTEKTEVQNPFTGQWTTQSTDTNRVTTPSPAGEGAGGEAIFTYIRGLKRYELTNHLGNVMAVITDHKVAVSFDNQEVSYYVASVISSIFVVVAHSEAIFG